MLGAALQSVHIKDRLPEGLPAKTAAPRRRYRPEVAILLPSRLREGSGGMQRCKGPPRCDELPERGLVFHFRDTI